MTSNKILNHLQNEIQILIKFPLVLPELVDFLNTYYETDPLND